MNNQNHLKLAKAKKRIKDLKGFYSHLTVYLLVNIFIIAASTNVFTSFGGDQYGFWKYFSTPVFWGVGILFHAIFVFVPSFGFIKKWEERKMKELIEDDIKK